MIVRPASKMFSAISFGVFWRDAPSTNAIMRSRNVSPGFDVMRTMISSERHAVPPVTAERSPPDSRITGADSPVIADSSTDAMPSMISPSPGISSPAGTTHSSPTCRSFDDFSMIVPSALPHRDNVSDRVLAQRVGLRFAPPSGTASAKFANRTVNHSHIETRPVQKTLRRLADGSFWKNRIVVSTLPTSTMNITGLRIMLARVASLPKRVEDGAPRQIAGSNSDFAPAVAPVLRRAAARLGGKTSRVGDGSLQNFP